MVDETQSVVDESPTSVASAPNAAPPPTTSGQNVDQFQPYADNIAWIPERGFPTRQGTQQQMSMADMLALPNGQQTTYGVQRMNFAQSDIDMDLSSGDAGPSDRPTPSSTTASDTRSNLVPGRSASGHSGRSSFETSPVASHQQNISEVRTQSQSVSATFYTSSGMGAEYISALGQGHAHTGLTPGASYSMPETPGRAEYNSAGGWEMSQGLTPIGEGVFRELMGISPMDMGWEHQT